MDKNTYVLIGNYGSGKSELALNFVMDCPDRTKAVLVDLDIINPYFRSSDMTKLLTDNEIKVIKPVYAGTGVEGLSLPPDIYSVFINECTTVVFDVGGDVTGSVALGQYKRQFDSLEKLDVLYVVNPHRPLSASSDQILEMMANIELRSRLKISGIINNSNLSNETTVDDLISGFKIICDVVEKSGIAVKYTMVTQENRDEFVKRIGEIANNDNEVGEIRTLHRYMKRDWERFTGDCE